MTSAATSTNGAASNLHGDEQAEFDRCNAIVDSIPLGEAAAPSTNGRLRELPRRPRPEASHDLDAERSILGALLLHADGVPEVSAMLDVQDLYLPQHQVIYRAILGAHAGHGGAVDPLIVKAELERRGTLEQVVGGYGALLDLAECCVTPVPAYVKLHVERVRDHAQRRRLAKAAQSAIQDLQDDVDVADVRARFNAATDGTAGDRQSRPTIEFLRPWQLAALPPRRHLWRNLLAAGDLAMLFGPWGSCKSFIAQALAVAMADGSPFLGHDTAAGTVLTICGEGAQGQRDRLAAATAASRMVDKDDPMHARLAVACSMPPLTEPAGFDATVRAIESVDKAPSLLIVDTYARSMAAAGLDENGTGDSGRMVAAMDRLRDRFSGMAVLAVHHSGNDRNDRGRGSSVLPSACDAVLRVDPIKNSSALPHVRLSVDKIKDGRKPGSLLIDFAEVVVRSDDRGQPVTSLRVDSFYQDQEKRKVPAETRAVTANDAVLRAMLEAGDRGITFKEAKAAATKAGSTTSVALQRHVEAGRAVPFEDESGERRWRLLPVGHE